MNLRRLAGQVGLAAVLTLAQAAAFGQTKQMMFGTTSVNLSFAFTDALASLGVSAGRSDRGR